MRKLSEDFRIGILGATSGLFASSVTLLVDRIDIHYAWVAEGDYYYRVAELWWIPLSFWHIVLSVVASFLVHGYLKTRLRSPFLLWQTVGITSLFGWGLTLFISVSLSCLMLGDLIPLESVLLPTDLELIGKYVSTTFACNVLYGSVMKASSQQYVDSI